MLLDLLQSFVEKYHINLLNCLFINLTLFMGLLGILINVMEPQLPALISQFVRYGKYSRKCESNSLIRQFQIPKSWFGHFYVFASFWLLLALSVMLKGLVYTSSAPNCVIVFLDFVAGGKERQVMVNFTSGLVVTLLYTMQCIRRLYEANFVQIFSSQSKINVMHYILAFVHYFGCIAALLANTEGFVKGTTTTQFSFSKITLMQYMSCFIFYFCWTQQYNSNMVLVNLRKDAAGNKTTEKHLIPRGGFFEFVSSPHMFYEIAMYVAMSGVIPASTTWSYIVIWVFANQMESAWLTHKWYKENFKNYPKKRYAICPYIL